jgi:hypothetical protein
VNPYEIKPYKIQPGFESTNFSTSTGLEFYVYFRDISAFGRRVFDFAFEPVPPADMNDDFPIDPRMGDTIAVILDNAFCSGKEVIVYHPHNNDPRRVRKFNIWYTKHQSKMKCGKLETDDITFTFDTVSEITLCFLYKPDCGSIIERLITQGDLPRLWEEKA